MRTYVHNCWVANSVANDITVRMTS